MFKNLTAGRFTGSVRSITAPARDLGRRANTMLAMALGGVGFASPAMAAGSGGVMDNMVSTVCNLIGPLAGQNSKVLSLLFLLCLGVIVVLWLLNENKEGLIVWMLRVGLCLAILVNIFSVPQLIGLPPICSGY